MQKLIFSDYNNLILKIYEAALDPKLWEEVALEISDRMHSGETQLLIMDNEKQIEKLAASARFDRQCQEEYIKNYYPHDLRVNKLLKKNIGFLVEEQSLLNEEEQINNREVSLFLKKHDLDNITGMNLSLGKDWIWFGTSRKGEGNVYSRDELAVLQSFGPHIRKSLRLQLTMDTVQAQARSLGGLWSYKGKGIIILEEGGLVSFSNHFAEQLIASQLITIRQNQLVFKDIRTQKRYLSVLGYMLSHNDLDKPLQDSFLASDMRGCEYGIRLLRHLDNLPALGIKSFSNILLVITPLDSTGKYSNGELERFGDLFHLTAAELRAVKMVSNRWNLSTFAASLGLKPDTIRHQLKVAMSKVGVHSQKELVRLLERFCFIQMR